MDRVEQLIAKCDGLSAFPHTVISVASMLADGSYNPDEMERLIRTDEALSTAVLRAVNSAFFGVPGKLFELKDGIVRLGSKRLTRIVLDHKTDELFVDAGAAYGLRRHGLWRSSVAGAVAAEMLAEKHQACDPSQAYIAALLRDIGKLAIESSLGSDALAGVSSDDAGGLGFIDSERAALGVDHPEVGAALAKKWELPDELCGAIRSHHAPPAPGEEGASALNDVVHAADTVAMWSGLAIGDDGLCYRLADHVEESLGIKRKEIEGETAETWFRVREIESLIGIEPQQGAA